MEKHYISFSKLGLDKQGEGGGLQMKKAESVECLENKKMSSDLESRVKKCFEKLYRILKSKRITLYRTFQAYDQERRGLLTPAEFQRILLKLDPTFTNEETQAVFEFVDIDHSNTIEFEELRSVYCKINGIPETLEDPTFNDSHSHEHSEHSHSKHSHSKHHEHSHHGHSHHGHHHHNFK